jgi:hypothetical protein
MTIEYDEIKNKWCINKTGLNKLLWGIFQGNANIIQMYRSMF